MFYSFELYNSLWLSLHHHNIFSNNTKEININNLMIDCFELAGL